MTDTDDVYVESAGQKYRVATLKDFRRLRDRVTDDEGWEVKYDKPNLRVWTKAADPNAPGAGLNVVKVNAIFPNVDPETMYNALHDPHFRKSWDDKMIEGYNVAQLDMRNDIGYYSAKFPMPLANRDFLNQRSWMEFDNGEYIIMNHSVKHPECPEKKGFVRGVSHITGYYLKPTDDGGGTELLYITHADIKGSMPHWLLNSATQKLTPSLMGNLGKHGENYSEWARQNHPAGFTPDWRTPKVSWDADNRNKTMSLVDHGQDEAASAAGGAATGVGPRDEQVEKLQAELDQARLELAEMAHRGTAAASLAQVAPRNAEDSKVIQQYRALMQIACTFVDRLFVEEGRTPSLEDYLTRLRAVLDGQRRTIHEV